MGEFWRYIEKQFDKLDAEKKQIQEVAKKDFGLFLDDISEINPLVKKLIDKSRIKWKV